MPYRDPLDPLYRADRLLYLWAGPIAIAGFGVLGALSDNSVFFGSFDNLGRASMIVVAVLALFARYRLARISLFFLMSGAFIGRAAALLSIGGDGLDEAAEIRSAFWYLFVWVCSVGMLFQAEIIRTWDDHHRRDRDG